MKKCPYCAEEIQDEAKACRYCGRDLVSQPTQPPPAHSKKKSHALRNLLLLVITGLCLFLYFGFNNADTRTNNPAGSSSSSSSSDNFTVTYSVTGSARAASLYWQNDQNGTDTGDYKLPFRKSYEMEKGDFAYISAQNDGETGSVSCDILVNGESVEESTSNGAYAIATCSARVGR